MTGKSNISIIQTCITAWSWVCGLLVPVLLFLLVIFLVIKGAGAFNVKFFFGEAPVWEAIWGRAPVFDGIWPALAGTMVLVPLSVAIAAPFGLGAGIYLALMAQGRVKRYCNFCVDLLAGIPSIVLGLFGFTLILFLRETFLPEANTCLLLAAGCLAILILPYLIWATQNGLEAISPELRLVGPALGISTRRNLVHILLPLAARPILGGVILAIGRAAEDTAVILLTGAVANAGLPANLFGKFEALPFFVYYTAAEYRGPEELVMGFGTCILLLVISTCFFILAIIIERFMTQKWKQTLISHP